MSLIHTDRSLSPSSKAVFWLSHPHRALICSPMVDWKKLACMLISCDHPTSTKHLFSRMMRYMSFFSTANSKYRKKIDPGVQDSVKMSASKDIFFHSLAICYFNNHRESPFLYLTLFHFLHSLNLVEYSGKPSSSRGPSLESSQDAFQGNVRKESTDTPYVQVRLLKGI